MFGLTCVSVEVPELCSRFTMKPNDLQYIAVIISRDSPPTRDNVGTYGEFLIASYWQLSRNFEKRPSAAACLCWDSLRRVIFMYCIQGTRKYHNQPKFPTKSTSVAHVLSFFLRSKPLRHIFCHPFLSTSWATCGRNHLWTWRSSSNCPEFTVWGPASIPQCWFHTPYLAFL